MVSRPEATSARETLTPLPPDSWLTETARWTSPRAKGPGSATVRSRLGLAVKVTIMRSPRQRRRRPGLLRVPRLGSLSVIKVSRSFREANWTRVSASSLEESASTTMRRAEWTKAALTAASSGSGVLSPKVAWMPLVPTKAMSGRIRGRPPRWTARRRPGSVRGPGRPGSGGRCRACWTACRRWERRG